MKRALPASLFLSSVMLLMGGILLYRRYYEWLDTRGLDRLSVNLLLSFALAAVLAPVILWRIPVAPSRHGFIITYLRIFAKTFGVIAGIVILLTFLDLIFDYVANYPLVGLPALFLLVPLGLIVADMFRRKMSKTPRSLLFGYGYYAYTIGYLLLAQFLLLPILFFMGPMALFFIFISAADVVSRLEPSLEASPIPILCYWAGIGHPTCTPSLLLLILLYVLLFFIAARFGGRISHGLSAGYHLGRDKLGDSIYRDDTL